MTDDTWQRVDKYYSTWRAYRISAARVGDQWRYLAWTDAAALLGMAETFSAARALVEQHERGGSDDKRSVPATAQA